MLVKPQADFDRYVVLIKAQIGQLQADQDMCLTDAFVAVGRQYNLSAGTVENLYRGRRTSFPQWLMAKLQTVLLSHINQQIEALANDIQHYKAAADAADDDLSSKAAGEVVQFQIEMSARLAKFSQDLLQSRGS